MPQKPIRVALYIRVSTEEQTERYGLKLQEEAMLSFIKSRIHVSNGAMIFAGEQYIYKDEGISGTVALDDRPAFSKLKEDILLSGPDKPFDAVMVYKIDRFARKLKVLLDVVDFFESQKINFISVNEMIDTSTPFGKAMLNIIGVIAELERETIAQRTRDGREQAVKQGKVMGVGARYGYTKSETGELEILKEEAGVVQKIFEYFTVDRLSVYEIAQQLLEHNIPSPSVSSIQHNKFKGVVRKKNALNHWKSEKIREMLGDEIYIGLYYYNRYKDSKLLPRSEWKKVDKRHPQIIDIPTFLRARKYLEESKHEKPSGSGHIYLLSGLLRCHCCMNYGRDTEMVHWIGNRKEIKKGGNNFTYNYKCGRKSKAKSTIICPSIPLPAKEIEEYIINFTLKMLQNPSLVYNHNQRLLSTRQALKKVQKDHIQIQSVLENLEYQKKNLLEQHQVGIIKSVRDLQGKLKDVNDRANTALKRKQELEKEISKETNASMTISSLEQYAVKYKDMLEKAKTDRKTMYDIIHHLFDKITVHTRKINQNDRVAGVKKDNQEIPYFLSLEVKIPEDILFSMAETLKGSYQETGNGGDGRS